MVSKLATLLLAASSVLGAVALPRRSTCAPFHNGTFFVEQYQLYPENADWDNKKCLLYFG